MKIRYLKHHYIDKQKWDACIHASINGVVYTYSWYLDMVSKGWEALVLGDYESVMPLPVKRKYGVPYVIQPKYTQQLGVFSKNAINKDVIHDFLRHIPKKFLLVDIQINSQNLIKQAPKFWKIENRINCELPLNQPYEDLQKGFNQNTKRNIKKANKNQLVIKKGVDLQAMLALKKASSNFPISSEHLRILENIIPYSVQQNIGETYSVYNSENQMIATAFFLISNQRAIYFMGASRPEGFEKRAMFMIVDTFIKEHCNSELILDFEGSNQASIARFFYGFGAQTVYYQRIRRSRVPKFIQRF